ncbi:hypothetical protein [uncultured Desulfosarcina sp.]|uniref:hypothetical protein n=1 Tax=uncultured Desulfosarcina sp. TaxID=218289 RepID=UPI0029C807ED|nr:hypothetical protein [uncultured Desulfosarcina sp.]
MLNFKKVLSFFRDDSQFDSIEVENNNPDEKATEARSIGFETWIPIFQGGVQVDSEGQEHDGYELIEKAIETFDPAFHEPPAVIGHPKDNAPAYGWVEALKKGVSNGIGVLLAKFKQVNPQFVELVRNGSFKKRSACFYPDGRLRHVGFLGALPPAVKGLPDVRFSEGPFFSFELSEATKTFSEQDLNDRVEKVRQEERHKAQIAFAEKELRQLRQTRRKNAEAFVTQCMESGKVPPAVANNGMIEFMEALQEVPAISFAECEQPVNPFEWMKEFVEEMDGFQHLFGEITTKKKVGKTLNKEDDLGFEIAKYAGG